ncbi:hypothetical protein REPUB_Repub16aG0066600 [Reevesia pubescens]
MGSIVNRAGLYCIATMLMAMVLLFNYQALAFSTTKSNSSVSPYCSGSMKECLIIEDANLVFFPDPATSLVGSLKPGQVGKATLKTGNVIVNCGRGKPYSSCLPGQNKNKKISENCIFPKNRGCK